MELNVKRTILSVDEKDVFKILPLCLPILGVELQLRIHTPEDVADLLSRLHEMKLCRTRKSEGYETTSQKSSEIVSEVKHSLFVNFI